MSNSKLVSYTKISPNSTNPRNHKIDTITIHHMAGKLTIEQCGAGFASASRQASSNYGVGSDGRIGLYVSEENRSWCSSSRENDNRAVTIEVANDGGAPDWHVSDKALEATINLCVDICQRNGIAKLNFTGDKKGNLTMHKWFAATQCPGPYLESKFPYIAQEVNKRLGKTETKLENKQEVVTAAKTVYRVQVGAFSKKAYAEKKLTAIKASGFADAYITSASDTLWRVQVGAYSSKASAESLQKKLQQAGYSGYVTTLGGVTAKVDEAKKTVDELAKEVIWGLWGNGAERKKRLTEAGYSYTAVQNRVNELRK